METALKWLFLDLNSYFASVEQQFNPRLRGKPVAVVPMLTDNTCAIAASYQAKAFGVKTGTLVRDARKMCPGIQFIEANHDLYIEYHHKIIEAVESCIPITSVMSVDEMICELRGSERTLERATEIAELIKKTLRKKVGEVLTCSIGLAPNRYLAKIAADMKKPDGLTAIFQHELPARLHSLPLRDFTGIGEQIEKRLRQAGVYNSEILCSLSKEAMRQVWGSIQGEHFYQWIRGIDTDQSHGENKSISHSHVLPPEFRTREGASIIAQKLMHKAAYRLRKAKLWCRSLSVHVLFVGDYSFENGMKMMETQDNFSFLDALQKLWSELPKRDEQGGLLDRPIKVSIWLTDLVPEQEHNLSFFENEKGLKVSQKLDEINARFGKGSLYFGGVSDAKEAAPNRIAFTAIPDLDAE